MALARPETTAQQQAAVLCSYPGSAVEQAEERVLDVALSAAQRGHRVATGYAGAQRLHCSPCLQPSAHVTTSSRVSSRTSAAKGLARRRSRTSSTTRSCSAL